jgi:hypothetical protein
MVDEQRIAQLLGVGIARSFWISPSGTESVTDLNISPHVQRHLLHQHGGRQLDLSPFQCRLPLTGDIEPAGTRILDLLAQETSTSRFEFSPA